jgi:dihydrofolate reductase
MWGDDLEVQQMIQEEMEATKDFVLGHCILCGRTTWDHKENLEPRCIRCVGKDAERVDR